MTSSAGLGPASTGTSPSCTRCAPRACRCRSPRTSTRWPRSRRCRGTTARTVRTAYAATLVKRQAHRPTFDTLFDLYFPRLVGAGAHRAGRAGARRPRRRRQPGGPARGAARGAGRRRPGGAAAAGRRGGRPLRRDARPRARAVRLVGVHRAAAALARRPGRADRRGARSRTDGSRRRRSGSRPAASARSPRWSRPTRAGGSRRRRGPDHVADVAVRPEHRPARLHRAPSGPTSRRCAARSTRWPAGSRPG